MTSVTAILIVLGVVAVTIGLGSAFVLRFGLQRSVYPRGPLAPERVDRPISGACGVVGCPNQKPHSHVADLARRLREKR
jgi:hypothetical protein